MKRLIKVLPLALGILMLLFSIDVYFTVSGFKLFTLNSAIGLFYVYIYKYTAVIGLVICLIYVIGSISKVRKFRPIAEKQGRNPKSFEDRIPITSVDGIKNEN